MAAGLRRRKRTLIGSPGARPNRTASVVGHTLAPSSPGSTRRPGGVSLRLRPMGCRVEPGNDEER